MKKTFSLLLTAVFLLNLWGCARKETPQQKPSTVTVKNESEKLYEEFLVGKRKARWENSMIHIDDVFQGNDMEQYSFFDMNHDGTPELLVRRVGDCYILTYRDNELVVWNCLGYTMEPLNNGAVRSMRPGGANTTTNYAYIIYDFCGNEQLRISFNTSITNEGKSIYLFEEVEVSKEQWEALTEKYFSIGSDKIKWIPYSE